MFCCTLDVMRLIQFDRGHLIAHGAIIALANHIVDPLRHRRARRTWCGKGCVFATAGQAAAGDEYVIRAIDVAAQAALAERKLILPVVIMVLSARWRDDLLGLRDAVFQ